MLPAGNIVAEPARRDTAPAVALGIGIIAARNPQAVMMVLPSDQLIQDLTAYPSVMRDALATAEKSNGLVTIGIRPTWPCPSYGYIERGERAEIPGLLGENLPVEVKRFREKPDSELAAQFLAQGTFSWNAGMFVWSLPVVIQQLGAHAPELAGFISELCHSRDIPATVAAQFPLLTPISIDYALLEHAERVLNIEATFDWDDVGSWTALPSHLGQDERGNTLRGPVVLLDADRNIVLSGNKTVALCGVSDLVVVETDDAILVCHRNAAQQIKNLPLPPELK
jgi:mannose-1-phosphate guanylyltransferase